MVHLIKCGQCGQLHKDNDIYINDSGSVRCCDCLGFVRRSSDLELDIDEVLVVRPDDLEVIEGDA